MRDKKQAKKPTEGGVRISGRKQAAYTFTPEGLIPSVRSAASGATRSAQECDRNRPWFGLGAGNDQTTEHKCPVADCKAVGRMCSHVIHTCAACKQEGRLPEKQAARAASRGHHISQDTQQENEADSPPPHNEMLVLQHNCANGKQVEAALQSGKEMEAEIMILQEPRK